MAKASKSNKNTVVLVKTTAGNTILNVKSDYVCSDVNGRLFLKKVSDVQEGELLYFEKEYIDKKLEDIESDLRKSDRYNTAYESLHIGDKPMFSVALNDALEAKGITDFNDKVSYIDELIDKGVVKKTIQNWLTGETVMVDNKSFLNELSELAPELKTWAEAFSIDLMIDGELKTVNYDKFKNQIPVETYIDVNGNESDIRYGARYTLYDLYKNIRIGVGHYLAKPKNEGGKNKTSSKTTTDKITLSHEIDIVVKQYLNYVTEDIVSAKVLGISVIDKKDAKKYIKDKNHNTLKKGVMKVTPHDLPDFLEKKKLEKTTLGETLNDIKGLEYTLAKYASNIVEKRFNSKVEDMYSAYKIVLPLIKESLNSRIIKHYGVTEELDMVIGQDTIITEQEKVVIDGFNNITSILKKELTYDENNIFEMLIDTIKVSLNSIPPSYFDVTELVYKLVIDSQSKVSDLKMHKTKLALSRGYEVLFKSYDYDFTSSKRKMFMGHLDFVKESDGISDDHKKISDYPEKVTEQDGIDALKKYGLDDLLPIIFGDSNDSLASYKND